MPSTPPISRIALVAPDAWSASSGRTALITTFATGATNDAVPMPARTSAGSSCAVGHVHLRGVGDPGEGDRVQTEPEGHDRASADPVREHRRRGDEQRRGGPREGADAGLHGAVVQHQLQELGEQDTDPNVPRNIASETAFAAAKARLGKKRIGSIGVAVRSPQAVGFRVRSQGCFVVRVWGHPRLPMAAMLADGLVHHPQHREPPPLRKKRPTSTAASARKTMLSTVV